MTDDSGEKTVWLQVMGKDGKAYKMQVYASSIQTVEQEFEPVVVKTEVDVEGPSINCLRCSKEFYNHVALSNHLKLQHGVELSELPPAAPATTTPVSTTPPAPVRRNTIKVGGQKTGNVVQLNKEQLISLAAEDLEYIIVKTEGVDKSPRSKAQVIDGRAAAKTDSVRIVEPFKRLQRSIEGPDAARQQSDKELAEVSLATSATSTPSASVKRCNIKVGGQKTGNVVQLDKQQLISLASEDVEYIIVKSENVGDKSSDKSSDKSKKVKDEARGRPGPKPSATSAPVNMMGPFECLERFIDGPDAVCHQVFFNCCEYSMHFRQEHTRHRKPGVRCQVCERNLDAKLAGLTDQDAEVQCTQCRAKLDDAESLAEHIRVVHAKPRPFRCTLCNKGFTQQGGLQQHMRMHTGDRPFACSYCDKTFTQKSGLGQHIRIHTKDKPYRCVVCNKSFCQSIHLKQHMRTHTHIAPYQCRVCQRRFKQGSQLNQHTQLHKNYPKDQTPMIPKEQNPMRDEDVTSVEYILGTAEAAESDVQVDTSVQAVTGYQMEMGDQTETGYQMETDDQTDASDQIYIEQEVDGDEIGEQYYTVEHMDANEVRLDEDDQQTVAVEQVYITDHVYTGDQVVITDHVETILG